MMSIKRDDNKWRRNPEILQEGEVRIRFRKVGQGDTILAEVYKDGILHLGIIDCKNYDGDNAVIVYLNYLTSAGISYVVSFIIISHPHRDHFSGAVGLFEHLHKNNIELKRCAHSMDLHHMYLKTETNLSNMVVKVLDAIEKKKKEKFFPEGPISPHAGLIEFTPETYFRSFAPDGNQTRAFAKKTKATIDKNSVPDSELCNLLSSIITISNGKEYVLLTSDAVIECFDNLEIKKDHQGQRLVAAQIPHHGSIENFHKGFWGNLISEIGTKAVFSVKANDPLHPAEYVIRTLGDLDYECLKTYEKDNLSPNEFDADVFLCEVAEGVDDGRNDTLIYLR